jgi:hypothetical protein
MEDGLSANGVRPQVAVDPGVAVLVGSAAQVGLQTSERARKQQTIRAAVVGTIRM